MFTTETIEDGIGIKPLPSPKDAVIELSIESVTVVVVFDVALVRSSAVI